MASLPPTQVISVTAPIQPAVERVKHLLFRPFDLGKWFAIGICAWLAYLGQGGFHGGFTGFPGRTTRPLPDFSHGTGSADWLVQARDEVMRNLYWIVPLAILLAAFVIALAVLIIWLSSRGQFMFLHCVALDRAEVGVPWRLYAGKARSLFFFRLALGLIGAVSGLLLLAAIALFVVRLVRRDGMDPASWLALIALGLVLVAFGLVFVIVGKLTTDFVVPIMFLRGGTCREAWRELLALFAGRYHLLIVYLLFQIVIGLLIGVAILIIVLATCCLAGCLLAIPVLGTVAILPVLVFQRAYSMYYLALFGPRYDPFQAAVPPPPIIPA